MKKGSFLLGRTVGAGGRGSKRDGPLLCTLSLCPLSPESLELAKDGMHDRMPLAGSSAACMALGDCGAQAGFPG
jgi:hypothetical protein